MAIRLDIRSGDFAQKFRAFLGTKREASADVETTVRAIVADVAAHGDRAVKKYTLEFDKLDLDRAGMKVTAQEIAAAVKSCAARCTCGARTRARPDRGLSPPASAAG